MSRGRSRRPWSGWGTALLTSKPPGVQGLDNGALKGPLRLQGALSEPGGLCTACSLELRRMLWACQRVCFRG